MHKALRKSFKISIYLLIQPLDINAIQLSQIAIQHHLYPTKGQDSRSNVNIST